MRSTHVSCIRLHCVRRRRRDEHWKNGVVTDCARRKVIKNKNTAVPRLLTRPSDTCCVLTPYAPRGYVVKTHADGFGRMFSTIAVKSVYFVWKYFIRPISPVSVSRSIVIAHCTVDYACEHLTSIGEPAAAGVPVLCADMCRVGGECLSCAKRENSDLYVNEPVSFTIGIPTRAYIYIINIMYVLIMHNTYILERVAHSSYYNTRMTLH